MLINKLIEVNDGDTLVCMGKRCIGKRSGIDEPSPKLPQKLDAAVRNNMEDSFVSALRLLGMSSNNTGERGLVCVWAGGGRCRLPPPLTDNDRAGDDLKLLKRRKRELEQLIRAP